MKFRLKVTLCMIGLLSVLFGGGSSLFMNLSFHTSLEREQEAAYNAYQTAIGTLQIVSSINGRLDDEDISHTLKQLTEQNANSWTALRLYTPTRTIYEYPPQGVRFHEDSPLPGNCSIRYRLSETSGQSLVLSGALEAGGETLYLDIERDISALFAMRLVQQQTYQRVFLLMVSLCAFLSLYISRFLTAPLVRLSEASQAIAQGNLSSRACITSGDEIGMVARDFNAMAEAMEENINQLTVAAQRQERFMGSFAHEVKTPMTSIIGYADLIRGQVLSPEEQIQAANYIVSEGKRLENLSQKLLELLVLKNGDKSFMPVSPAAIIYGLAAHMESIYHNQGIELSCDCQEGMCLLEPDLFKSLLINLWDNARKAMEETGGRITLDLQMLEDGCRITVCDSGCGIHPDALTHLTDAFYRVDKSRARSQGGVGLGLSLCSEIAALHHGSIQFQSELGKGTRVVVELRGGAV